MENQHRKITGYRELSAEEIDLMNRIKATGAELLALHAELEAKLTEDFRRKWIARTKEEYRGDEDTPDTEEFQRFEMAEPKKWADFGKTNIQVGIMALVRAVAQPAV
ncbi:hypothetical protein DA70_09735 [Pandoraea pnomenusa]|uniref:Acb2/Tad1 domain-containing protein n=1 Tax=Pandoraea pnomenusa TaxID=93220 RepID=UPI00043762DE|nr:hypothetical protein [Pandoraea pnomenusa]AHN74709.1 hypothetical protein DA70_09735 [Pandoraea pnomenusa]